MANFRRDNRESRGRSSSRPRRFEGRDRRSEGRTSGSRDRGFRSDRSPEFFDVTCDKCGKECKVPFKPTGDRPVLCSECFRNKGDSSSSRNSSDSGISQEQFKIINEKLDMIIEALSSEDLDDDEEDEDN
jgi:CxxC-x17-CxxC domain-containing protein